MKFYVKTTLLSSYMYKTLFMKKIFFYPIFLFFTLASCAQPSAVKTHIYSRVTLPGMRPENDTDNTNFPKNYFIYAEVKKGVSFTAEGCWIDGRYFPVTGFEKITTPVIVMEQSVIKEQLDTLVQKTANDVYQLTAGEEKSRSAANDGERKLVSENKFVLLLKINGKKQVVSSATIKELVPAARM